MLYLKNTNYINVFFKELTDFLIIKQLKSLGAFLIYSCNALKALLMNSIDQNLLIKQIDNLGVKSINICVVTGAFSGAVMAIQSYRGFQKFGGHHSVQQWFQGSQHWH